MLHDQSDDCVVLGANQFEHGDFADLPKGQGVDDEGYDGRADNRKNHQEHENLFGRGGDQFADQDLLHLVAGIDRQAFPAADRFRHLLRAMARSNLYQHRVDVRVHALRSDHRVQQPRCPRAVKSGVCGGSPPLPDDGVVVLQELRFLRILQGNENHRIAAGRDHSSGQADHGVVVAADPQAVTKRKPGGDIGDRFVMAAGDLASGDENRWPTGRAGLSRRDAGDHRAHVPLTLAHLHGEIGNAGRASYARHSANAAPDIVVEARRLGIGAEGVFLHHPEIGAAVVEQGLGVIHHAAINAGHGQGDPNQQPKPHAGKDEFTPGVHDVAAGQADHRFTPGI